MYVPVGFVEESFDSYLFLVNIIGVSEIFMWSKYNCDTIGTFCNIIDII